MIALTLAVLALACATYIGASSITLAVMGAKTVRFGPLGLVVVLCFAGSIVALVVENT